jgi:hypothetical protein
MTKVNAGTTFALALLATIAFLGGLSKSHAQSADALINKLVEKGILTVKEGNELREEAEKNFNDAYATKSGMPDWVQALKFNGDVRVRYEGFYADDKWIENGRTNRFTDRNRFRIRARLGVTATMLDNLEAGIRFTTGDNQGGFGGNPLTGNQTETDNASKKYVYIDTAYVKWSPLNGPDWSGSITIGKMDSPFLVDDMVIDYDYTPEGAATQVAYQFNDQHSVKFIAGGFVLDEIASSATDPYLIGGQLVWNANWNKKWSSSAGVATFSIQNPRSLTNSSVPNINRGNTRNADGTLAYEFYPVVGNASVTYLCETFPLYQGPFPIKPFGEYMYNYGAPSASDNYAWNAGVVLGKSGKKNTWEVSYMYKWLGANAWWEELVDDDFGAFYGALNSPPNSGFGPGFGGGTNAKGHIVRFAYSPTDAFTFAVKWFLTDLIRSYPSSGIGSNSRMSRLQVDGTLQF